MSLLRQPLLLLARSSAVKKLVSSMPVSAGIVRSYVPGETTESAVEATARLADDGLRVTLDHLGEDTLDVAGPLWLLTIVAVVDAVLGSALGLFVSAFAQTEFQAVQFMPAIVIPQLLLCGLLVPRDLLPPALERISDVLPLSYAVDAMQHLTTSADTSQVWHDIAIVAAFAVAGLALGAATLRRRTS